ncbi:MAG: hypothetical protein HKN90_09040 [Flavobacteriaceae bacterium]|nr:hypothetical protein [Flavobacteriaceae bacterium]
MIFYGAKGVHLKSEKVTGVKCSYCEQQGPHTVSVFGKYAYLYWIPFFPIGKKGVSECDNCKRTLEPKEMNADLKLAYQNVKSKAKTPITHWAGTAIILVIVAFTIYSVNQHKKDVLIYLDSPEVGDVYEYQPSDFYSLLKVTSVSNDSVFVSSNKYEVERKSRLRKINKDVNFDGIPYGIGKQELLALYKSKKILDIDRD